MIEGTKKQQAYKLIIGSIDVNAARYVLVLPMAVNTASLIFEGRSMISTSGEALFKGFMIGILEAGEKLWKLWSKYQKMKILEGSP
ncbi:hypothetical protein Tco_1070591 [Tanacetum coccineum]|uniref:Uncharacterized protein n=1 Tax=Tanacetum coccineum TaxID=301880 RepID=A0ABQ5HN71_9ASTR